MASVSGARRMLSSSSHGALREWVAERTNLNLVTLGDDDLRRMCFVEECDFGGIGTGIRNGSVTGRPKLILINVRDGSMVMLPDGPRVVDHGARWLEARSLSPEDWCWFERTDAGVVSGPACERWREAAEAMLRVGFVGVHEKMQVDGRSLRISDEGGGEVGLTSMLVEVREGLRTVDANCVQSMMAFVEAVVAGLASVDDDLFVDEKALCGGDHGKTQSVRRFVSCIRQLRMARDSCAAGEKPEAAASIDFFVERLCEVVSDPVSRTWVGDEVANLVAPH